MGDRLGSPSGAAGFLLPLLGRFHASCVIQTRMLDVLQRLEPILAEGAIALPVTLSGGVLFAS